MNICLLCNEYPPARHGGIGPVTQQLAEGLCSLGHSAVVVGLYSQAGESIETINGVAVHRLARVGRGIAGELRSRLKLTRYLGSLHSEKHFDLFEAPEWRGDTCWLRVDSPVVLRLHTSHVVDRMVTGHSRPGRLAAYFEDRALRRSSRVCAVSADIAEKTATAFSSFQLRKEREAIPVIHNAIELDIFQPELEPRESGLLVFAGSLKPKKGIVNLLKAFELVVKQFDCRLVLAGADTRTGDGGSYLADCIRPISAEARKRLDVLGSCTREQVAHLFCRASAVVLPSLQEACPMVVMEAMACGAPTIFGACGPHAEIIEDGIDGFICDPWSPSDIAEKILMVLDQPERAVGIGGAARQKAEMRFTEERFLRQTIDFYQEAIAGHQRGKKVGVSCP